MLVQLLSSTVPAMIGNKSVSLCNRFQGQTVAFLTQSLTPSVSFVCLPYHHRVRILHRCLNCFHHCIVLCIIVAMSYHALLRFVCIFHSNQSTFCIFVLLYIVACDQYVASTRHLL